MADHVAFMREALAEAHTATTHDEVPVGAVVVAPDGAIIGRGFNRSIGDNDPTAHAEIVSLRDAARNRDNYRLSGCTVYVTVEPCLMCAGALVHARISRVVFGTPEPRAGALRSVMQVLDHPALNHQVEIVSGVLEDECRELIQAFFTMRRETAKG